MLAEEGCWQAMEREVTEDGDKVCGEMIRHTPEARGCLS